uniref:Uncharacterized protein n=1 Tax=Setaria digitata TaxID=48799 RepID=A0A915PHW3_9BILA
MQCASRTVQARKQAATERGVGVTFQYHQGSNNDDGGDDGDGDGGDDAMERDRIGRHR